MAEPQDALPPEPWSANESKTRVLDGEGNQIAQITCPNWGAVAALLLRAPGVEQAARALLAAFDDDDELPWLAVEALTRLRVALGARR